MKNNKILIIIVVIFLNLLVIYMVGQNIANQTSEYDIAMAEAQEFSDQKLYSLAIEKYQEALDLEKDPQACLKIIETYKLGIASGEISNTYSVFSAITDFAERFPQNADVLEAACRILAENKRYEDCVEILKRVQAQKIETEALNQLFKQIQFKHKVSYGTYNQVMPEAGGFIVAEKNGVYSYLDTQANEELEEGYIYATSFTNGYAYVQTNSPEGELLHMIIDENGQRRKYIEGIETSSGVGRAWNSEKEEILLLACKIGNSYAYFDMEGNMLEKQYAYAGRYRNNVAAIQNADGKWQLINGEGKAITEKTFSAVSLNEMEECAPAGIVFASDGTTYHMYDINGAQIGSFACDEAKPFVGEYAAFKSGDKWGFVDKVGNVVIEAQYADAKSFSNGMGAVLTDAGWCFINAENEMVITEAYADALYLTDDGICFVKMDTYWGYLEMYYTK